MKRSLTLSLISLALLGAAVAAPAGAASKPKPAKPVTKTYYFHGSNAFGAVDQNPATGALMGMDATKPTGTSDKTFAFYGVGAGGNSSPNASCAGGFLNPNWVG